MTLQKFIATENKGRVRAETISTTLPQAGTLNGSDTDPNPTNLHPTENRYEENCPYRPWAKKFRLIENFPR